MSTTKTTKSHILYVDGLRAVAALYVALHHIVLQQYNPDNVGSLTGYKKGIVGVFFQGRLAVNLFIVISGFSLMLSVLNSEYHFKNGTLDFFKRRAIRILPPYYFSMLLSLILVYFLIGNLSGTHWDISVPVGGKDIITHLLLIHDFFLSHQSKINHAFWSIAVECRIYLLFPALLWLWRKKGASFTLVASLVTCLLMFFVLKVLHSYYPDINRESPGVNPYLILFVLGMFAADISFSNTGRYNMIKRLPWTLFTLASVALFGAYKIYTKRYFDPKQDILIFNLLDVVFGLLVFCVLVMCYQSANKKIRITWLTDALSWRPLVFIGTFSYSLYLVHAPLVQVITQYIIWPMHIDPFAGTCLTATVGLALLIVIAYVFFIFCERPFLNILKNRKTSIPVFEATQSPAP